MKTPSKPKPSFATRKPRLFLSMVAVGFVLVLGLVWLTFDYFGNYAEKTAKPLESALIKAGAVKQCSQGDNGRGWDSPEPDYSAIYEVPGTRDEASTLVLDAAKKAGFNLARAPSPSGAPENILYEGRGQPSKYNPEASNAQLLVTVFAKSTYVKVGQFCGVKDQGAGAPSNKTTIDFTVSLPALY